MSARRWRITPHRNQGVDTGVQQHRVAPVAKLQVGPELRVTDQIIVVIATFMRSPKQSRDNRAARFNGHRA